MFKNTNFDNIWFGILLGIIFPPLVFYLYYVLVTQHNLKRINVSICMVINLVPFYLTLNKEKYKATKGVLIATFIWSAFIAYLSFFTDYLHIL